MPHKDKDTRRAFQRARWNRYMTNPEFREKQRERGRVRHKDRSQSSDYRTKISAQGKARYAVRTGRLYKSDFCTKCGSDTPLVAHHWNGYDRPLDIEWLCRLCHARTHRRMTLIPEER